ncbi:MAG TPA: helix-turn-helix transcriptional regulator [Allocoleopsis sp.]
MPDESWVFRVVPAPGESLGHFLGRFRRANELSHRAIADHLGVRVKWVEDWEIPSKRRNPTELQLIALSKLVEVDPKQLAKMLPLDRLHLQTRLCAACYAEAPVHLAVWQRMGKTGCDRHALRLLTVCPVCQHGFRTPALWDDEHCEGCGLAFGQMQPYQEPIRKRGQSPTVAAPPDGLDRCQ